MSFLKDFLVSHLMPEKCYERIFVKHSVDGACVRFVLNKVVGLWITMDAFFAQLPQLLLLLWRGRADGLSLTSSLLQLYAFSCPVVYATANNFPFMAWADRLLALAQTAGIIFLILHYRGGTFKGMLLLLAYSGVMFLLGSHTPQTVASVIQASSIAALIASKAFQAGTNYSNGHTGQLSALSVFLTCAGSLSALYLSLMNSGSSVDALCHVLSACLSCGLLVQIFCYSKSSDNGKAETNVYRRFFRRLYKRLIIIFPIA